MSRSQMNGGRLQRSLIVFPALALVVSLGYVSSSQAEVDPVAKRTSTTVKKKRVTSVVPSKGSADSTGDINALVVLGKIVVAKEQPAGYSRSLFKHWVDADSNGCNTREEVLISESTSRAQVDAYGCTVIEGDWLSPYDNVTHTNPSDLDIDHMIPLKEAWDSGAHAWSSAKRKKFANDLSDSRVLIAVTARQNRVKSDRDPSNWIPPNTKYLCTYLAEWISIKFQWRLTMDSSEFGRIKKLLIQSCATTTVVPWGTRDTSAAQPDPIVTGSTTESPSTEVRQVTPVRCKKAEFGMKGQYRSIPYVCSDRRANGSLYAIGYFYWRPA